MTSSRSSLVNRLIAAGGREWFGRKTHRVYFDTLAVLGIQVLQQEGVRNGAPLSHAEFSRIQRHARAIRIYWSVDEGCFGCTFLHDDVDLETRNALAEEALTRVMTMFPDLLGR